MYVNLLWSTFSSLFIPGIWHKLKSVIWAGSRHSNSSDPPLLERKDNFSYVGRPQAPPPRGRSHYMTSYVSLPQSLTGFTARTSDIDSDPMFLKWKHTVPNSILHPMGGKEETWLLVGICELCPWKYLLIMKLDCHVISSVSWC